MWKKIWNPSNRKVLCCNVITALLLNLFLEYMERKSLSSLFQFIEERTFIFLFNGLILFMCLSVVFVAKKKLFVWAAVTGAWALVGTVNGIILNDRKTPFTAVDLTLAKSILPILQSYLAMWQIVAIVVLVIAAVILLVTLYLYCSESRKAFDLKTNVLIVGVMLVLFGGVAYIGAGRGMLIRNFDNLIDGYKDYGVAYGFCVTALDTGIDRPIDYSNKKIKKIEKKIQKSMSTKQNSDEERNPNIIFIQLESFFDLTTVKNLQVSEDPIPNFHRIQQEYTSGFLRVPVYGAGTINTEFEVITGMSSSFFGTGEYPYRSILQSHICDSMAYWLSDLGYESTVIHNNNASFYDRNHVFANLGFDNFITIENMNVKSRNEVGWAKDSVLTGQIMDTLSRTTKKDLIYAISVQAHGDYPKSAQEDAVIQVTGEEMSEGHQNQLTYYANEIYEMDEFLQTLTETLEDYPEETIVVAYGDHLPGIDVENEDLTTGSRYKTPYFIWDNFGYNREHGSRESEDISAYQLAAKVFGEVNINNGILNQYHQGLRESKNYKKNLKMIQYDMLYGADFISKDAGIEREATEITYCLRPIRINEVKSDTDRYLLLGENFTQASRVYVNGIAVTTKIRSPGVLEIPGKTLKDGDEIVIHQVSETNENITLNQSPAFEYRTADLKPLYRNGTGD